MADGHKPLPRLEENLEVDVAIVGGGYFGLWTALLLKEARPDISVAVIEKDICGGGASGRNAGYLLNWWSKFPALEAHCGSDEALALAKAAEDSVKEIENFCKETQIGEFCRSGWLWAATCDGYSGSWGTVRSALKKHGIEPFEELGGSELKSRWGLDGLDCAVVDWSCAEVQPARLAFGLKQVALSKGVKIFENTEMRSVRSHTVETQRATISAGKVLLAINAWMAQFRSFRSSILIAASELAVTQPAHAVLERMKWTDGPYLNDSRLMVGAARPLKNGRIVFGKGGGKIGFFGRVGNTFEGPAPRTELMTSEFKSLSSHFSDLKPEHSWLGSVDRTSDSLPMFGHLQGDKSIVYGCGFSGNGVGPTRIGAKIARSLILEDGDALGKSSLVRKPPGGFPPEPFRQIGGRMVMNAVHRADVNLHNGKKTSLITKRLASLAPSTLVSKQGSRL